MKNIVNVKCVQCEGNFDKYKEPRKNGRSGRYRKYNSITCSPKCSREWAREVRNGKKTKSN